MKRLIGWGLSLLLLLLTVAGCQYFDKPEQVYFADEAGKLRINYLDVGQGDCTLIQTPAEKNILIDAGTPDSYNKIKTYLDERGITRLDVVVATHPHSDHIGSLPKIIDHYAVGAVYAPKVEAETKLYQRFLESVAKKGLKIDVAKAGVTIDLGDGIQVKMYSPVEDKVYKELNDYSPVMKLTYGETAFVFTGDAEKAAEADALSFGGRELQADVLKVGHHGSYSSTNPDFFRTVNPDYAVISLGRDNTYGYPHHETLETLSHTTTYRTDTDGDVKAISDGQGIGFKTQQGSDAAANAVTKEEPAGESGPYIGNVNSKVFHRSSCGGLPKEKNQIVLETRETALEDGYRPCPRCNP